MPTEERVQILVVDDENGPQEVLKIALASKGFQVRVAKAATRRVKCLTRRISTLF